MGKGYFSGLRKSKERYAARKEECAEENVCIRCKGELNRFKATCDFCYLRGKVSMLQRTQTRIMKLLMDGEEK